MVVLKQEESRAYINEVLMASNLIYHEQVQKIGLDIEVMRCHVELLNPA